MAKHSGKPELPYPDEKKRVVHHGELHDQQSKRWCKIHLRWIRDAKWGKHVMCDVVNVGKKDKKDKPKGHALRKVKSAAPSKGAPKPKRTSKVVKYCSKHGKFVGFAWCGHRRLCKAKEVIKGGKEETAMSKTIKTMQRAHARLSPGKEVLMAESMPIRKPLHFSSICLEMGIRHVSFVPQTIKDSQWIRAMVTETFPDHPSLLPFVAGDYISKVNDTPFRSSEEFIKLIGEVVQRKEATLWVTVQHGEAAPIRRTVTFRSSTHGPYAPGVKAPDGKENIFVPTSDIVVKVEQKIKTLDEMIADAKNTEKLFNAQCVDLNKRLRDARDNASLSAKKVGDLEGERKEFLNKIGRVLRLSPK